MNYREQLKNPAALRYIDKIALEVMVRPEDFSELYALVFETDMDVAWRAAWVCDKICEKHPDWYSDSHFEELSNLFITTKHGGLQRGCLFVLNIVRMPESISVGFINTCFERMVSPQSPIAVQALSMKMLLRICKQEPAFIPELKAYLEDIDWESYSAGFKSTRKNVLKALDRK
jgi:hypothetical protein